MGLREFIADIPTYSVYDDYANSLAELVYVGLYPANGGNY